MLLYNVQTVTPVTTQIRALAKQHGIPVVGVSETMPAGVATYQQWQQSQLDQSPARARDEPEPVTAPLVELRGAAVRIGTRTLWSELDLALSEGEFLAVLGPNGTGKTTLLKVLLGLVPLSAGTVQVNGAAPHAGNAEIGYVPQQQAFDRNLPVRGRDLVRFGVDGHRWGLPSTTGRRGAESTPCSTPSVPRRTPTPRSACSRAANSNGCASPRRCSGIPGPPV